jgi:hypothetical protein
MTAAKPIPFSVEELESIFTLDRRNGCLIRMKPAQERKDRENFKTDYRYVSINGTQYFEHRLIWMLTNRQHIPSGMDVDHINRDKLDNRPENLRLATSGQNQANAGIRRNNRTGYKGVFRAGAKFRAAIRVCGTRRYLGTFDSGPAAAMAYDGAALAAFGEYAMTNAQMGLLAA